MTNHEFLYVNLHSKCLFFLGQLKHSSFMYFSNTYDAITMLSSLAEKSEHFFQGKKSCLWFRKRYSVLAKPPRRSILGAPQSVHHQGPDQPLYGPEWARALYSSLVLSGCEHSWSDLAESPILVHLSLIEWIPYRESVLFECELYEYILL